MATQKDTKRWEFGDFQTPESLAETATTALSNWLGDFEPQSAIEPTCGVGAFLLAAANTFPGAKRYVGLEIEKAYVGALQAKIAARSDRQKFEIHREDFFSADWARIVKSVPSPIVIVGNPPWVTSSDIGRLGGANLPEKSNFQKYQGFDAVTGKSNFDISEWMILQHIEWLKENAGCLAMLCKTSVARKILRSLWRADDLNFQSRIIRINALKHFGASVDASFFMLKTNPDSTETPTKQCPVFGDFDATEPEEIFGFSDGIMLSDAEAFMSNRELLGADPNYVWRSGLKHDCAKVMELRCDGATLKNGFGEVADFEAQYVYPLLKSSDIGNGRISDARYRAIVTQTKVGEDTNSIERIAPKTWDYLCSHGERLDGRGSVIYKGKPRFSIFGIGEYSFSKFKVAISGFYKKLKFQVVGPINEKPTFFDDTIYFLSADTKEEADFLAELLNSPTAREFYRSMIFWSDKRPITADLLKRLNLEKLAQRLGRASEYAAFNAKTVSDSENDDGKRQRLLI